MKSTFATLAAMAGTAAAWGNNQTYGWSSSAKQTGWEPTVTVVVPSFETTCAGPTTFTYGTKTYTATKSEVVTVTDCPCKITTPVASCSQWGPTATVVTTSFETYCPKPTTVTYNTKTYTVTEATTLTVTDAGECTIATPWTAIPTKPWTAPPAPPAQPTTWTKAAPPAPKYNATTTWTTDVVSTYTTYCPTPTVISHGTSTITVTKATTVTFENCPCTISKPMTVVPTPPAKSTGSAAPVPEKSTTWVVSTVYTTYCPSATTLTYQGKTIPVAGPSTVSIPVMSTVVSKAPAPPAQAPPANTQPAQAPPANTQPAQAPPANTQPAQAPPANTQPAAPAYTQPAQAPPAQAPSQSGRVVSQISDGQIQAPATAAATAAASQSGRVVSQISDGQIQAPATAAAAQPSSSIEASTGGAGKLASSGAAAVALIAGALFF